MTSLIDEDVPLRQKRRSKKYQLKPYDTYPLEITVDHPPIMHVYQALCDVTQLHAPRVSGGLQAQDTQMKTDEFEPIYVLMVPYKSIDVPAWHPFRHHCKLRFGHNYPYQRQHVWMMKSIPQNELLAEPLYSYH